MKYEYLAVSNDDLSLPLGLIDSPQDIMRIYKVSQATAYRIMRTLKFIDLPYKYYNPSLDIVIEVVPKD